MIKDNQQGTGRDHRVCERMMSVTKENKAGQKDRVSERRAVSITEVVTR